MTEPAAALASRLAKIQARIGLACEFAGRDPRDVLLVAVSKGHTADAVRAIAAAGQLDFGENYLQEALEKLEALVDLDLQWHFIGPLQANKTRAVAERFAWVHTVDRLRVAERLSAQRPADGPALNVCVQVNISGEKTKHGASPAEAETLCRQVLALPRLKLRGLMALPAPTTDAEQQRTGFAALRRLFLDLQAAGLPLDVLSMGSSGDYESAIAEGAHILRIGTDIFGPRPAAQVNS